MFSLGSNPLQPIRTGKSNNNTRIWLLASLPCMQVWKMTGPVRGILSKQKKLWTFFAFVIFPVSSKVLSSLMESWYIVFVGIQFFSHKFNLKKVFEPLTCPGKFTLGININIAFAVLLIKRFNITHVQQRIVITMQMSLALVQDIVTQSLRTVRNSAGPSHRLLCCRYSRRFIF